METKGGCQRKAVEDVDNRGWRANLTVEDGDWRMKAGCSVGSSGGRAEVEGWKLKEV